MAQLRPVIVILVDYYPPAFRAGGPTRSVANLVERLGDRYDLKVVTRDKDLGSPARLPGITANRWSTCGKGDCLYLSRRQRWPGSFWWQLRRAKHDILYFNSLFSVHFTLVPLLLRRFRLLPRRPVVIAPRGELDTRALRIKEGRKKLYLRLIRVLRLTGGATWHATSPEEAARVRGVFGASANVVTAPNIPRAGQAPSPPRVKRRGALDVVFLGRISPMKNLRAAIDTLEGLRGRITFNIFGPIEDHRYWVECMRLMERLPASVSTAYQGLVSPEDVGAVLAEHHLFLLPTLGENFGHAIVESLLAGCPVLISDRTPWHGLEAKLAGWEVPLDEKDGFTRVIQQCVDMDAGEFAQWSGGARRFGHAIATDPRIDSAYTSLFATALVPRETRSSR